ncbi:MAG: hypothetical protein WCP20_14545 [Desulfuromonadales bacterium]
MRKAKNEMRPEYDFSGAVRGKYAARYDEGVNIVKLDGDVFEVFRDEKTVNDALRTLIRIAQNKAKVA